MTKWPKYMGVESVALTDCSQDSSEASTLGLCSDFDWRTLWHTSIYNTHNVTFIFWGRSDCIGRYVFSAIHIDTCLQY